MNGTALTPRGTPGAWLRLRALLRRTGVGPPLLAALLVAHLVFGGARLAAGAVYKRAKILQAWFELGPVDWHYRHADDETRRIVHWLLESVGDGEVVLIDGDGSGQLQLLAPLLFPRLLVLASSTAGRQVFAGHAAWHDAPPGSIPVVVGSRWNLRVEYR